jgi:hypothetical protein
MALPADNAGDPEMNMAARDCGAPDDDYARNHCT